MISTIKIAFVVGNFPALSETFVLNQITGLIDLGHEVDIYAHSASGDEKVHSDIDKYGLLARTYYLHSVPENKLVRIIKALILFAKNFHKDHGLVFSSLNFFRHGRAAYSLRMFYPVISFAGKHYDIIHCHYGDNGSLAVLLKEAGFTAKVVTMFHGWDIRVAVKGGSDRYYHLFRTGDCFLSISNYNYQNLLKLGAAPEKIISHPVGIDLIRFSSTKGKPKPDASSPTVILTVARLVEDKGLEYGIQAVHRLTKMNTEFPVLYQIVGEGPLAVKLKAVVGELDLGKTIHFLGEMNQGQVIRKMEEAHIFLLPSVHEALPVVLMEAQAMGLLVVATRVGSTFETLQEGESGFLVPPRDPNALAERLTYLIEHPDLWPSMRRTGRQFVEKHYNIQRLNSRLVKIYEALLV